MFMRNTKYFSTICFVILVAVIAAGCSDASKQTNNITITNEAITTDKPIETPLPEENLATEKPEATIEPMDDVETNTPGATKEPVDAIETVTPEATKNPGAASKPTATVKPTTKPVATTKPGASPKPTKKPIPVTPTEKPIVKPTATPKPSSLPIATPSPSPKPTTKPDPDNPSAGVTVADIAAKLTADTGLGSLMEIEGDQIKESYGIDPKTQLVDGIFNQPMIMIQAGEFSIVQLKSEKNYSDVEAAFKKRAEAVQKVFETYVQDQYEQALNYQIIRNGDFVLFSITPDQVKTAEIFNEFFKKK